MKWLLVLLVGTFFLPLSPILSILVMFLTAKLFDNAPLIQNWIISLFSKKEVRELENKIESDNRQTLASSTEDVFLCKSCGAVYTMEFLKKYKIPDNTECRQFTHSGFPKGTIDKCESICFYCANEIKKIDEKQGYFEQKANDDNIATRGSFGFQKPLRYRSYITILHPVKPQTDLFESYKECVKKQIFLHFASYVQIVHRINPANPITRPLLYLMGTNCLPELSKKYDTFVKGYTKEYDFIYSDIES